ncbi:MAG TPA: transglutaminase family protein [Planctomycetaceae bacterium]|nr:transglutaminase family protein [Planctomycetaceae bacterium]
MEAPLMAIRCLVVTGLTLLVASSATGQFKSESPRGPRLDNALVRQWRFGVVVTAGATPLRRVVATTSVPTDWPEQQVRIVQEEVSPGAQLSYRTLDGMVKQLILRVPRLPAGSQARGVVIVEVTRSWQLPPENTAIYVAPEPRELDRQLRPFLLPSPYIESDDAQIKALARQITADRTGAWQRVEAIYDWVRQNVRLVDDRGLDPKPVAETLGERTGDCDELSSLFIAICRAAGIPARMVRVPGHCYPEFYLEDDQGRGYWFPCQAGGGRAFGGIPEHRPILQKGDNLLIYDPRRRRKVRHRFLPDTVVCAATPRGGSPPSLDVICQPLDPQLPRDPSRSQPRQVAPFGGNEGPRYP